LVESLGDRLTNTDATLLPRAREIALLAIDDVRAGRTLPPESAVPVYIRNDVARPKMPQAS
jgi:tRNA A37 threonylcarbamoyladenosine modification protein TsaB